MRSVLLQADSRKTGTCNPVRSCHSSVLSPRDLPKQRPTSARDLAVIKTRVFERFAEKLFIRLSDKKNPAVSLDRGEPAAKRSEDLTGLLLSHDCGGCKSTSSIKAKRPARTTRYEHRLARRHYRRGMCNERLDVLQDVVNKIAYFG